MVGNPIGNFSGYQTSHRDGFGTTRGVEFSVWDTNFFQLGCPKLIFRRLSDAQGAKRQFMNPKAIDLCNIWHKTSWLA